MDGQLEVSLGANVTNFSNNVNSAADDFDAAGVRIERTAADIQGAVERISPSPTGIQNFADLGEASIGRLKFALEGFRVAADNSTNTTSLVHFNRQIELTENEIDRLRRAGTAGFNEVGDAVEVAGQRVQSFSMRAATARTSMATLRTGAHGLTGGVDGLGNAFPVLIHHFQTLVGETGSTKAAFATLQTTLLGPAGILLAVSALAPLLVDGAKKIFDFGSEAEKAEKQLSANRKALELYISQLGDVTKARLTGAQSATDEITKLKVLYGVTQDTTVSQKQRQAAVDDLQKSYPAYFKNISDESFLVGGAKDSYDRLTQSIIATAKARAAEDLIATNSKRQLTNQQQINDQLVIYDKARQKLDALDKKRASLGAAGGTSELSGVTSQITKARNKASKELEGSAERIRNLKVDTNKLDAKNLDLTTEIMKQVKGGADLTENNDPTAKKVKTITDYMKVLQDTLDNIDISKGISASDKEIKKIDAYQTAIKGLIKIGYDPASEAIQKLRDVQNDLFNTNVSRKADTFFNSVLPARLAQKALKDTEEAKKVLQDAIPELQAQYEEITKPQASDKIAKDDFVINFGKGDSDKQLNDLKDSLKLLNEQFDEGSISLDTFKEKYANLDAGIKKANLGESIQKLAKDFVDSGISDVANAIGESFANGTNVLEAAGNALLGAFGKFLQGLGKLLIEYGTAAVVKAELDAAMFIPGAGLIAGVAAIAAGAVLVAAGAAVGSFASGKKTTGTGAQKPTSFAEGGLIYQPTLAYMGEYAGARSNPEVVAPLNKLKSMIGDKGSNVFIASSTIRGEDIVTSYRKANAKLNRV